MRLFSLWIPVIGLIWINHPVFADESIKHVPSEALSSTARRYLSDDDLPSATPPLIEIGAKFLRPGNIKPGFTLPTGAVWSPSLWVFGNFRTAYQLYEVKGGGAGGGDNQIREWANRLDLFANLQLTGTERILLGLTPLHDRDSGEFSGKVFGKESNTINGSNLKISTLFFEGDFSEIFPNLDLFDSTKNDIGFTLGRQRVLFMDGFLVNDRMDGFGLSKNNIRLENHPNLVNWRSSLFVGLNGIHRHTNDDIDDSKLIAWFNQFDTANSTYNIDMAYVSGDETGDLFTIAIDATQRLGKFNTTFRIAASQANGDTTEQSDNGAILFTELSWVPAGTHDNAYLNAFVGIDNFTSAARGPTTGGPLGRTGILFAAQGLGTFPAPLSNSAQEAVGFSLGYQKFFSHFRRQIVVEIGARFDSAFQNEDDLQDEVGLALRFQQAMGRRTFLQFDAYVTRAESESDVEYGTRIELQVKL